MLQKRFAKVREIAIGITGWCDPLVYLNDVHLLPWNVLAGQVAQHDPRSVATADGDDEAAASSDGSPRFSGDEFRSFLRDNFRIRQDFDLHGSHFPSLQSWRRG